MSTARRSSLPPEAPDERARSTPAPRRRGPHLGPLRITPSRVFVLVALIGGLGFLAYSIFFRDALQVPLMATGFAVCGIAFAIAAFMSLAGIISAGREGRDGRAFFTSLVGGLLALAAMGCLAAAVIMGMIWTGTSAT
jgi:drug/metabolite transporter (DMT)-like permease